MVSAGLLDPDADQPRGDVSLPREQVIHGRLFDLQGRPAAGVEVRIDDAYRLVDGITETLSFGALEQVPDAWPGATSPAPTVASR